jgi:hypothetical protein
VARKSAPKTKPVIPKGLARALVERKPGADSEELLNALIEVWGGTKRLATDLYAEFKEAPSGGMVRQRILEMIQRLIITNTTHEIGRTKAPSDMSDEELAELALAYIKRVAPDAAPAATPEPTEG